MNNNNLQVLSQDEMNQVSGGDFSIAVMGTAVAWGTAIVGAFTVGFQAGYTAATHYWGPIPNN